MIRMKSKEGAFMHCYTPAEIKRAESRGWVVVEPQVPVKSPVKKTRKKVVKK